jgi:diketogulonate reductase-like aldo/keto reductase
VLTFFYSADWGLEYFDLFLIHFPISLQNIPIEKKYPAEWQGLDGNVNIGKTLRLKSGAGC